MVIGIILLYEEAPMIYSSINSEYTPFPNHSLPLSFSGAYH